MTAQIRVAIVCAIGVCAAGLVLAQGRPEPAPDMSAPWSNEQEWIVADVATAVLQMRAIANRRAPAEAAAVRVHVRRAETAPDEALAFDVRPAHGGHYRLAVTDHIWSHETFAPLLTASGNAAQTGCPAADPGMIGRLLDPAPEILEKENARISAVMSGRILCRAPHEEAALLLGSFALREAATMMDDTRRVISRMAAHLAFARATQGAPSGDVAPLADAVLMTLIGRQQRAVDLATAFDRPTASNAARSWSRALRLRNTSDWRMFKEEHKGSRLEQLAMVRARAKSLGSTGTLSYLDAHDASKSADLGRLLMHDGQSVEAGHRFLVETIEAEISDAVEVRRMSQPAPLSDDLEGLVEALNVEPSAGPLQADGTLRIIDWGTWAAAAQRHILIQINSYDTFLGTTLGLPDEAKSFRAGVAARFSRLRLYPFVSMLLTNTPEEQAKAVAIAAALLRLRPELATDWTWKNVQGKAAVAVRAALPSADAWFRPYILPGTLYDARSRPYGTGNRVRFKVEEIKRLSGVAPFDRALRMELVRRQDQPLTADQLRAAYGELGEYDLTLAREIAKALYQQPERYIAQMERVGTLDPSWLTDLGLYLVDHGRMDEARAVYSRWLREIRSELSVANSSQWLIRDHFERGEHDAALALARRAAEVYSNRGLLSLANLHDWRGEHAEAERQYRAAYERYNQPEELLAFYLRSQRKGKDVDELIARVFPTGMQNVQSRFAVAPTKGIVVRYAGIAGERQGLKTGDIIVAVEGVQVETIAQYRAARGSNRADVMNFLIWRDGRYADVRAKLRYNWPINTIEVYRSKPARQ